MVVLSITDIGINLPVLLAQTVNFTQPIPENLRFKFDAKIVTSGHFAGCVKSGAAAFGLESRGNRFSDQVLRAAPLSGTQKISA